MKVNVDITHPDRVLFPADGITKGDLVDYYAELAPVMLPHLAGRPLILTRFPGGIDEEGFIQQNFVHSLPDWMKRAEAARKGGKGGAVVHRWCSAARRWCGRPTRTASRDTRGCRDSHGCSELAG